MPDCPRLFFRCRSASRPAFTTQLVRIVLLWLMAMHTVLAAATELGALPAAPLGRWLDVISEKGEPLTLHEATER